MNSSLDFIFDRLAPLQTNGTWEWPEEIKLHVSPTRLLALSDSEKEAFPDCQKAMCWDGAYIGGAYLSRWLLDNPAAVAGKEVADWGSGSGIVAISAAKAGAKHVFAIDKDPFAIEATERNALVNGVRDKITLVLHNALNWEHRECMVITMADILYDHRKKTRRAIFEHISQGRTAYIANYHETIGRLERWSESLRTNWPFNFSMDANQLGDHSKVTRRQRLMSHFVSGEKICWKLQR